MRLNSKWKILLCRCLTFSGSSLQKEQFGSPRTQNCPILVKNSVVDYSSAQKFKLDFSKSCWCTIIAPGGGNLIDLVPFNTLITAFNIPFISPFLPSKGGGSEKNDGESFQERAGEASDATLNEPVPRLIRMLACDCQKKKYILCPISLLRPASIALLSWSSYTKEFVYLKTRLLAVPVLLEQESFLREQFSVFQWKWAPKVYSISFIRPSCITYQKKFLLHLPDKYAEQAILREQA